MTRIVPDSMRTASVQSQARYYAARLASWREGE
jgi:hypothetical protein